MTGRIVGHGDKTRYFLDGKEVPRATFEEAFPPQPLGDGSGLIQWHKPVVSDSMAVHERQVPEAVASAKARGVPVEFQADGRPVFRSSRQMRAYAKAYGWRHHGY